jgi:hypothetical protein
LIDGALPRKLLRQWVLSLPFALRFLLGTNSKVLTEVLGIVYRTISGYILKKAGLSAHRGREGAMLLRSMRRRLR